VPSLVILVAARPSLVSLSALEADTFDLSCEGCQPLFEIAFSFSQSFLAIHHTGTGQFVLVCLLLGAVIAIVVSV